MSEYDYEEDEALIQLSEEELEKLNRTIELFIRQPDDTENLWILIDDLALLEDNLKNIKKTYYDGFDKQILKSKTLLESAYVICSDKTVKALIEEAISKVKQCLERLGIKEEPEEEPKEPKYEPYRKYGYYPEKYGYKYPYKEPKDKHEELAEDLNRDLTYLNKEPLPDKWKLDLNAKEPNPEEDNFWLSVINKIEFNKQEYQQKKQELEELNKSKIELSKEQDSLSQFRKKLLDRCISNLIEQGRE
jgi:hypothetical protein